MHCFWKSRWTGFLLQNIKTNKSKPPLYSTKQQPLNQLPLELQEVCKVISSWIGGLDDLELRLNQFKGQLTYPLVSQIIDSCKHEAPARRILRFFLWSIKVLDFEKLKDEDFNHVIRVLAEKKDHTGMRILISDIRKEGRVMDPQTFALVAETLVKLGREDEALGMFKNLEKFKCRQDGFAVTAIISALCAKGHAKKAQGENVKEARKVIQEMKGGGLVPDLFCYNTFLKCLCERNLKRNPSGLVPEALNVMMEMRSYRIEPNSVSYNTLLSCLGRARRVKESYRMLETMKTTGCAPDWVSYFLVAKVMYLTCRFGKGNEIVDEMIGQGLLPDRKFYYNLIGILCGVERVSYALELFERMKTSSLSGYGPVYDILIPKLCKGGDFEKGRELWEEATAMGVSVSCSSAVLDPSITEVFKSRRKVEEEVKPEKSSRNEIPRLEPKTRRERGKVKKKIRGN
uniref:Pentacotripeptide-repeat region of PRORP domain-containing protein n=1 Tax=Salix viminalis TaxID=40686 RepID=A0A6N2N2W7_SALVM